MCQTSWAKACARPHWRFQTRALTCASCARKSAPTCLMALCLSKCQTLRALSAQTSMCLLRWPSARHRLTFPIFPGSMSKRLPPGRPSTRYHCSCTTYIATCSAVSVPRKCQQPNKQLASSRLLPTSQAGVTSALLCPTSWGRVLRMREKHLMRCMLVSMWCTRSTCQKATNAPIVS